MPPKRPRRTSPAAQGLSAGERLKRAKLTSHDYLAWNWVGTTVHDPSQITQEHCAATCGFSDANSPPFCVNRYRELSKPPEPEPTQERSTAAGELDDDIIVVSDDETPACSIKVCRSNPNCLNYLGQEKWENEGTCCARGALNSGSDFV